MTDASQPPKASNYQPNSHAAKKAAGDPKIQTEDKKIEKIVTGEVVQRKKPLMRRIAESFAGEDVHDVGSYVLFDVALPTFKTLLSDVVSQGVERLLFGDAAPRRRSSGIRTNYNGMYSGNPRISTGGPSVKRDSRPMSPRARANHDFAEIVLADRGEAQDVVDRMSDFLDQYDVVSVGELYKLVGIVGSFTDDKWGWNDLAGTRIVRVRDGYLIDLPRPIEID